MKLLVVGFGQCGNRIADEFARLNRRARRYRGVEIITGALAVDTDTAALGGLQTIKPDHRQRIVVGETQTRGHGVSGLNELGAQIAREDGYKVIDAIRGTKRFTETDAFLLIAGAAGGTGSGAIPIMAQLIKERYVDRPVYSLLVLPFEHEEEIEPRTVYNTAVCLKSVHLVADAVFLIDNQRYAGRDFSLAGNIAETNKLIVDPFFSLLCTSEEQKGEHIGVSMLDAADIKYTLSGWTAIGYGKSLLPIITMPWQEAKNKGIHAMDEAISELSVRCNTKDAARALYLVSAPDKEMSMDLMKQLGDYIRSLAPETDIRYGDYPVNKALIDVTVILSELREVEKVTTYYTRAVSFAEEMERKQEDATLKPPSRTEEAEKDIPTLS